MLVVWRLIAGATVVALLTLASPVFALDGQIGIHDPSTVIQCDGKFYVFGTGGGGLISDDGWTWRGGAVRPGGFGNGFGGDPRANTAALKAAGINACFYVSPLTAHEWQSWRRSLHEFASLLFQNP